MKLKTVLSISMSIILSLVLAFSLTTSAVFGETAPAAKEKTLKCPGKVKVLVEEVKAGIFREFKDLEGKVLPLKSEDLTCPIPGAVKKIEKTAGTTVKAGDLIVVIDKEPIEKEIAQAMNKIKEWKKKLFRYRNYKVRSPGAEKRAEQIIKENEELLAAKKDQLEKCDIVSSIDGMISDLNVNEGDFISEGFVLGTVINTEKVKIPLTTCTDKVTGGQKIKVTVKELSETVAGVVNKNQGTGIIIDNRDKQIKPGMSAHFRVLLKEYQNAVVLPGKKLLKDDTGLGPFVYIVEGSMAKKAYLKTGPAEKENVLILEGLSIGDEWIVSEILSAKEGTVKEDFPCLYNNKKIKIMERDEEKGKFVKRKKGKAPVKKEKKIKPVEKPAKKEVPVKAKKKKIVKKSPKPKKKKEVKKETAVSRFRIGATIGYYKMFDSNFEDVYGRMVSLGLDLSVMLTEKLDIWVSGGVSSKTVAIDWSEEDLKFNFTPLSLDLRYFFKRSPTWDFYAGAGFNLYSFKDTNPIEEVKSNAFGFNILGGTYYHLSEKFALQLLLRFNMVKKTIENADNDLNMNSAELLFGISYGF